MYVVMNRFFTRLCAVSALVVMAGAPAFAQKSQQSAEHTQTGNPNPAQMPVIMDKKGVTSWNTLAKVKQVRAKNSIVPQFTKEVAALNDQEIKIQGFMMPLEPGEKQKHFLISHTPPTCSYCLPAGPEGVVEVKTKKPIKFTLEPLIISGKMEIMKNDPMGLYYRMNDASISTAN